MAAHAFLLCSLALLSALSRPGLSFSEEEFQPGLIYEEVPKILDRRRELDKAGAVGLQERGKDGGEKRGSSTEGSKENPKQATRVTSSQDGGYGLQSEEVILTPEDENPLRRILQPFNWHQPGMSHSKRKLLQSLMGPYGPLSVSYNGKTCILFKAKRMAIRYRNHTFIDLTEKVFNTNSPVDTKGSICTKEKATLSLRFGDVEDLRGLVIRLQMSNTFYEAAGQNWFTLDSVHIHYNWTQEATFNASEVYAPATSSYHCQHVSSLHKYDTLLVPSSHTDTSANWHITFTDFQIQAFNVQSDKFASASDCATFLTPAILMGLVTSLILLLVLAYALHMVVHLKHIDRYEEHKATVYFPRSPEAELPDKNSL
ncbi:ATPase H+ transporting accessory protein 1 like b [Anoplopoma fimbria]|uniref:ATPase H+ transporting accessory protein 1 like b n=1 Tax=Anoplopoma fimbria TaxID=229290 RepID=UPI0023EABB3A|nr:ATPase H+ transporting accessory protein 1 like b [Anoplopoma fimbria]